MRPTENQATLEEDPLSSLPPDASTSKTESESSREPQQCTGTTLRQALGAALAWLEQHADSINSLNVFPVPDGDTGTNMVLTLRAALAEAANVTGTSVGETMRAIAHGALMGARGNSGVILSQLLRGVARALENAEAISPADLGEAFLLARDMAYQGVMRPVEGTILTVAKEVAAATALAARSENMSWRQLLAIATDTARHAVAATPSQLPVLAEAGVVDAGGQGLYIVLEGIHRFLNGMQVEYNSSLHERVDLGRVGGEQEYGYDTQFIINGTDLDIATIRETLAPMGESLIVAGDHTTVKVHIHTDRPGDPLNYAVSLGSVSDVVIENMQEQYQDFIAQRSTEPSPSPEKRVGIVTVAQGAGLKRVMQSLGADVIIEGGQTMNPSIEEILAAVESLDSDEVIVLPNNSNIIMAAQQATSMMHKQVAVVPTRTIPEGISALLAYNYERGLEDNAQAMEQARNEVQTIEVTVATRSAKINKLRVKQGQYIAILNTELVAAGGDPTRVVLKAFEHFPTEDYEIVTIYCGADADQQKVEQLLTALEKQYPHLEIEVIQGDQPHYSFVLAVE